MHAQSAERMVLDGGEHFQKMSYRNRYRIAGANNSILLSLPLVAGRNQHTPMNEVQLYNGDRWQVQHWRTLVSVYRRSPYFEFYELSLKPLYDTEFTYLKDFNHAALLWARKQLRLQFEVVESDLYIKEYPAEITDLRQKQLHGSDLRKYYQVFEDRIGFIPDLSILDLLFSEGPNALAYLR